MSGDDTSKKRTLGPPWQQGQSGNPAGRPKGARSKLSEAFIEALYADFAEHGVSTVARVREEKPEHYLKLIASLVPHDINVKVSDIDGLSDEDLIRRIRELDAVIAPFMEGEAGDEGDEETEH